MFSTQKFLSCLAQGRDKRLWFYPSAGSCHGFVCDSNADIIIFSDFRPKSRASRHAFWKIFHQSCDLHNVRLIAATNVSRVFRIDKQKWGIFLFLENNRAVKMIRDSGLQISTFIGVTDGCAEGGNYECCNETPFFEKIVTLMPDAGNMSVITDHSPYLFCGDGWGEPNCKNCFILNDTVYETSLIKERVPGFRKRACEFVITKKCRVNEDGEPRSSVIR